MRVERGVAPHDGIMGRRWQGWAREDPREYRTKHGTLTGPRRFFRFVAVLDSWRLARKLR